MLIRHVSLVACLCWAGLAAYGDPNGAGYVFHLPGPTIAGAHFQAYGYNSNPFNALFDGLGPTSASQVLAVPDGSKFYMLGAGGGGLESIDPTFTTFRSINGLAGTPCTMAITPNGKYLLVASALTCPSTNVTGTNSIFYILDTSNDSVVANSVTTSGVIQQFAISQDSKSAWILGNSAFGSSVIAVNLTTRAAVGQPYNLPFGGGTSITLSPMGLLYVTEVNRIFEIDPATLQVTNTGEIPIVATPGPLRYTPDGLTAYLVNSTPSLGGVSLIKINLQNHQIATWPLFNSGVTPPVLDDVFPVSNSRVFAFSSVNTTLWDVTPAPLSANPSTSFGGTFPTNNVLSVAASNEQPAARYLYVLIGNGNQTDLERLTIATSTLDLQTVDVLGTGILQFVAVPPQTGTAAFVQYTTTQTVKPSATSLPLTVIATDGSGRPVYNVPVTYTLADPTSTAVINGAAQTTNANGFATTTVTAPAVPGNTVINVSAGSASASFTITVPGSNGGGGGGPSNGPTQVSIVAGNGDLLQAFNPSPTTQPLTVKVVDTNGVPIANKQVDFSVISGPGSIDVNTAFTDQNGLASTDFFAQMPQQGLSFQSTDVNASTDVGGVDFVETTYILNQDGTGQPQISLVAPTADNLYTVQAGEGDVVPNGIVAGLFSSVIPDIGKGIPNVGIRIADQNDITQPGPATCQGSSLSDNTGFAHCNLIATCQAGIPLPHLYGMSIIVGEARIFQARLQVNPGSTRALSILNGNNQTGRGGQVLPIDLTALVNDSCSTPIPGVTVTWAVTQGDAKLSNVQSLSASGTGLVSARVTLGQTPGPVQVTVSIAGSQQVFNITNQVVVSSLTLISGGGQVGFINQTVAQPLTFQVKDANNNPVPNAQVTFTVTGNGQVNQATGTTNAQGQVSTTVQAGSTPSTVVVTANYAGFTASASITIKLPGPALTPSSFQNAASFQAGLVPCGLATVIGAGLAPNVQGVVLGSPLGIGPLPYTLATVTITINGVPVPLYSVVNINGTQQITFQTPCETLANSAATVVVNVNGTATTIAGVQVLAAQPGIFTYPGPNNTPYGVVISAADGSYVTPSNPAKRGGTYYMVATGMAQTTPAILTNAAGTANQNLAAQSIVGVANYGVPVNVAQYLQGSIGEYLISFTIPNTLVLNGSTVPFPTGTNVPLSLGIVINGQTIFSAPAALPAVQ